MEKGREFVISKYEVDFAESALSFYFETHFDHSSTITFVETLCFPSEITQEMLERTDVRMAIESLHILLGISYYRLHISSKITLPYALSEKKAHFWNTLYTKGLGEFFYKNKLDFHGLINFPVSATHEESPTSFYESSKALILHGGGKDSLVSVEITRNTEVDFDLFSLHTSPIQELAAEAVGKIPKIVKRTMDKQMLDLIEKGECYSGHVPITAMYSLVAVLYALMNKYAYVIVSSEASANYGSVEYLGIMINHQWSKSFEAEQLMQEYIESYISADVQYFSLLRPLHEIQIVKIFSHFRKYFTKFSSSNHNFTQSEGKQSRWDVQYSRGKVEFVFALFTAFLPKEDIVTIFGETYYDNPECLDRFKELLGKTGIKPLDCVGTPEETAVAMYMAYEKGEYGDDLIMRYFESEVLPGLDIDALKKSVFEYGDDSRIPETFRHSLQEMIANS